MPAVFNAVKAVKNAGSASGAVLLKKLFCREYYKKKAYLEITEFYRRNKDYSVKHSPDTVVLEVNNTCNLNCVMCQTQSSKRQKGEMSVELFEKSASQVSSLGVKSVSIHTIGEPFLAKNFRDILSCLRKNRLKLVITTNGLLIHKHIDVIKAFPDVISRITFSIDGATKKTYENLRKGGSFDKLMSNLELVRGLKKSSWKRYPFRMNMQAALSNENIDEIPAFFRSFRKYFHDDDMRFSFLCNLTSAHAEAGYYKDKKLYSEKLAKLPVPCKLLWRQAHVLWNGDVSACCRDYNGEMIVGNINKDSISAIWQGHVYERLRKIHKAGDMSDLRLCRDCWRIAPEAGMIMNHYIHYLFHKFRKQDDKFYNDRIRKALSLVEKRYEDGFVKTPDDLSVYFEN